MKLISWNVNGLRACVGKGFLDFFKEVDADIFCIQETKLQEGQIELETPGYRQYWNYAEKKGYSGTAVFTKKEPLSERILQAFLQRLRYKEIIDAPPRIFGSGAEPIRPPGISPFFIGIKMPECIYKTGFRQLRKFSPLFIRKSRIFSVCLRIFQIDLFMGYIQIPAENNRFFCFQPF